MKKILLIFTLMTFLNCNQKKTDLNLAGSVTKLEQTEKNDTIFWIDTISNGKFLKIYSKPENDWQNLTAEYGTKKNTQKVNLKNYQMLSVPFSNRIEWITEKSFALVNGCGTSCKYVLIFNIDQKEPIIQPIEFYPEIEYSNFKSDNPNLYIAVNENFNSVASFVIIDTDSQKKDTISLPKNWIRGIGNIVSMVDKINIENSKIEVTQNHENGKKKVVSKIFTLE